MGSPRRYIVALVRVDAAEESPERETRPQVPFDIGAG